MIGNPEGRLPWYRVSSADVVFIVLAAIVFTGCRRGMLDDPGLGWHLRNVDAMIEQGGWLTSDPFSGPRGGQPYLTNQWLGEIPFWLGERWAGLEGIAGVATVILALMLTCLYRMMMRDGVPWPVAVMWIAVGALATSPSWVARPNLFTMFFLLLTWRVCVLLHEGRCSKAFSLWLLPLFAVWANTHGGFIAGFTILGGTFLIEATLAGISPTPADRHAALNRAVHMGVLSVGAFLATLANPYGYGLYPWILQLLGEPFFMGLHLEWRSPDFHQPGAFRYELLMLLFPLILGLSRRRPNLVELGLAIFWLHMALTGVRYVALWVLIAVPVMARCCLEILWLQDLSFRMGGYEEKSTIMSSRTTPSPWLGMALGALMLVVGVKALEGKYARHNPSIIPQASLDRLVEIHRQRPQAVVFHAYDWGGYLTWKGWPGLRNWIDDRNEVQGRQHIEDYFAILEAHPGWEMKLADGGVDLISMFPGAPLTRALEQAGSGWRELHRDPHLVIFERASTRASASR